MHVLRFLIIAVLAHGTARAQAPDSRLERLDAATRATVATLIDSARAAGLPTEPLVDRALEGAAKHAPAELIAGAVRRLADRLGQARNALGGRASPGELEAGAAALRAGADPAVLADLRRSRARRSLTVPLGVLADLVASGVPPDSAAKAVLVIASAADADLIEFRRSVEHDIALGVVPATAAAVRVNEAGYVGLDAASGPPPRSTPPPRRP